MVDAAGIEPATPTMSRVNELNQTAALHFLGHLPGDNLFNRRFVRRLSQAFVFEEALEAGCDRLNFV